MNDLTHLAVNVTLNYMVELIDHGAAYFIATYGVKVAVAHTAAVVVIKLRTKKTGEKKIRIEPKL